MDIPAAIGLHAFESQVAFFGYSSFTCTGFVFFVALRFTCWEQCSVTCISWEWDAKTIIAVKYGTSTKYFFLFFSCAVWDTGSKRSTWNHQLEDRDNNPPSNPSNTDNFVYNGKVNGLNFVPMAKNYVSIKPNRSRWVSQVFFWENFTWPSLKSTSSLLLHNRHWSLEILIIRCKKQSS